MTKITKATFKKFIRDNKDALHINVKSSFSGMDDCVMPHNGGFKKAEATERNAEHTVGINGAWLVGSSRDYFNAYDDGKFVGIEAYNCCGSFIIAIPKQ